MIHEKSNEGGARLLRKRQGRTRRILAVAMRLVEERGLAGFTLGDLATELDYSAPALYRYFPSKNALVAELQRSVVDALDRDYSRLVERCGIWCDAHPSEDLRGLLPLVATAVHYDRFAATAPELFGLLSLGLGSPERMLDDEHARTVVASAESTFSRLASLFETASRSKHLKPAESIPRAVVLWASLQGVVQLRKIRHLSAEALDPDRLLTTVVHALFEGWGASSASVTRALEVALQPDLSAVTIDPGFEVGAQAPTLVVAVES